MTEFEYAKLARCGEDVRISPHAVIVRPELVTIGSHVAIDPFVVLTTTAELGNYIHISPHCSIIGGADSKVVLEDFSGMSAGSRLVCGSDDFTGEGLISPLIPMKYRSVVHATVRLKKFVQLGTNVVVHPGVTIGEGSVVGSCSLVTKDLEPWGIYLGVPARRVRDRRKDRIMGFAEQFMKEKESMAQPGMNSIGARDRR